MALLGGCYTSSEPTVLAIEPVAGERAERIDRELERLVAQHDVVTAGIAVIRAGEVVWTGYYGEQRPGVPASRSTQFNVASITKTVSTEALLRLVERGEISLDESMASHWVDPDVADDPRHARLTPRMALNHTTGFLNWRFFADDNVLRFVHDPGTRYGYSGEGFEYVARFVERKLGTGFDRLVEDLVFEPNGMTGASFGIRESNFGNIARPIDEGGTFHGYYCRPDSGWCPEEGYYSAADDMVVTVEDYAAFLISVMEGRGYGEELASERDSVQVERGRDAVVDCANVPADRCPQAQGYGLGWEVLDFGQDKLIGHGGSDWAELALAYFYTGSHDGLVIFLNAPIERALGMMPEAIALIDPDSPMADRYRRWRARALEEQED